MIRPLTCICMLLAAGSGLYLYQSKHQAQMLDREIARTLKATDVARDRIGVLRGEWALLNEPERLAALSQTHLGLKTLTPSQFVTPADLGARLPPPVAPGTVYPPAEEEIPTPMVASPLPPAPPAPATVPLAPVHPSVMAAKPAPAPPTTQVQVAVHPPAPPRPPVQVASALPPLPSPLPAPRPILAHPVLGPVLNVSASPIVTAGVPTSRPVLAHTVAARQATVSAGPSIAPLRPTAPASGNQSIGESVSRMAHLQGGSQVASAVPAAPQPAYSQTSYSQVSASALGGVRPLLPPPVPFGSAMAVSIPSTR